MLRASGKGIMGLCRITLPSLLLPVNLFIMLLPDREPALDFFLLQGVCFPPLLAWPDEEGVCVFGSAAVSVCLPVAGCCTDTSTGGRHKLNPVALLAPSPTKLHWVEASHVSAVELSTVWVPASRVSLEVFLHLHGSELWAVLLPICWLLLPKVLSGQVTFSITFWSSLRFIWDFRSGVRSLGWVCLCFGFPCGPRFEFRLSEQQAWSIYEAAAWRHGRQHSSS